MIIIIPIAPGVTVLIINIYNDKMLRRAMTITAIIAPPVGNCMRLPALLSAAGVELP